MPQTRYVYTKTKKASAGYLTCSEGNGGYRYGYQGSGKIDDIAGTGNHYTTYFRELDARLGKWWAVDAYRREYFTDPVNMHKVVKYSGELNREYLKELDYQIKDYDIGEPR